MKHISTFEDFLNEAKKYRLGAKYSSDFDYDGMLEQGAKAKVEWGVKKLKKLHSSFEDVNYHSEGRYLSLAIEWLEDGDVEDAKEYMKQFNDICKEALDESLTEGKDLRTLQRQLDKIQSDYEDVLDDAELDTLSDFIMTINNKIKNK